MKKTDIALIIIIISISAGIAYWVASVTIGKSNDKPIVVRTIEAINTDETKVDETVFSKNAINPTVETTISGQDLTSFVDANTTTPETEGEAPTGTGSTEGESTNKPDDGTTGTTDTTPVVTPPDTVDTPPIGG